MSELLAPAGGMEALIAAVQNGADAVYFGARLFNARRGADNFGEDGLKEAVSYCHARGVRAHVTLNTLVRDGEMAALEAQIREIAEAGADAVIVQDLGVAALVRQMAPGLSLHASTQMAVHDRQGVEYLRDHGFDRAVLAREMPLAEIEQCAGLGVELEAFCHGALCVCCSGQCLFSSLVGGRSGNRGMCAQPCRLPYRLGEARGYLLSPRDIMLLDELRPWSGRGLLLQDRGAIEAARIRGRGHVRLPPRPRRQAHFRGGPRGAFADLQPRRFQPWLPARYERRGTDVSRAAQPHGRAGGDGGALRRDVDAEDALAERRGDAERPVKAAGRAGARVPCAAIFTASWTRRRCARRGKAMPMSAA